VFIDVSHHCLHILATRRLSGIMDSSLHYISTRVLITVIVLVWKRHAIEHVYLEYRLLGRFHAHYCIKYRSVNTDIVVYFDIIMSLCS
jgi:hypothetical protein